jgi:aminoglycoside 3-N-acetyltransferase
VITAAALAADLARLGIKDGDIVMVHAACRRVGPVFGGVDAIIASLRSAVGPAGTLMAYLDWDAPWEDFIDTEGRVSSEWRPHVLPFDPASTRGSRQNGILPEFLRTTPGAFRSGNPGASMTAIGARAQWLTADHPLDYGYGPGTPLARLVEARGKVLMLGAPLDTMTLIHHAEHLARLPDKRVIRREVPFATPAGTVWRMIEEFDTCDPVVQTLPDNFIEHIVTDYLASGGGTRGRVGNAPSVLVDAADVLEFAIPWLERVAENK